MTRSCKSYPLTADDRRRIMYEMRYGAVMCALIIIMGGIFGWGISLMEEGRILGEWVFAGALALGTLFFVLVNRKHIADLRHGQKVACEKTVSSKEDGMSYEAGSGALYIPILGDIFPKLWKHNARGNRKFFIIIEDTCYTVSQDLYDSVENGDTVTIYYTAKHRNRLGMQKRT